MIKKFFVLFFVTLVLVTHFYADSVHSYVTGGNELIVFHNSDDTGIYYDTPWNQVAYNVQIVKVPDTYYVKPGYITVYHSEPNKGAPYGCQWGDSIKVWIKQGSWRWDMPVNAAEFRIWGPTNQAYKQSMLWSHKATSNCTNFFDSVSGGGNPMVIAGHHWLGDLYYYVFFIGVVHDNHPDRYDDSKWRHYLFVARTLNFITFYLQTDNGWQEFNPNTTFPKPLQDINGNVIRSEIPTTSCCETSGFIGSIVLHNKKYYFFLF